MRIRDRLLLALGIFATTYVAHSMIVNLRAGRDWFGAFFITLTLISAAITVDLLFHIRDRGQS